jgi:hypothetical protein
MAVIEKTSYDGNAYKGHGRIFSMRNERSRKQRTTELFHTRHICKRESMSYVYKEPNV